MPMDAAPDTTHGRPVSVWLLSERRWLESPSCWADKMIRASRFLFVAALLCGRLWSQTPAASTWSFYANAYGYIAPHNEFYVSPTLLADHKWLHLEARYNYENQRTGSVWGGY